MRRAHSTLLTAALAASAALVLAACQADRIPGPSMRIGEPVFDMTLAPAGNADFPKVSSQRVTEAAARDTIEFTVDALPPTGAGTTYVIMLVDSATGRTAAVTSRLIRTVRSRRPVTRDSSVATTRVDTSSAPQFSVGDTATTMAIRIANPAIPSYTHVVLRTSGEGSTPLGIGASRTGFLSFRYHAGSTYAVASSVFGSFAAATLDRLPFVVSALVGGASFWGDQVRISLRNLTRPPAGFRYAAWMVDARTGVATRLGGLLAPVPDYKRLDDADLGFGEWYTRDGITDAQVRGDMKALGIVPQDFTFLALTIEPYGGSAPPARPGTSYVLSAAIPSSVMSRSASPGKVYGSVTSTLGKGVLNTTIYLQGAGALMPGLTTVASVNGTWQFPAVHTGVYKAYAIPFGDVVIRDSATVTVGARKVGGSLVGDSVFVTLKIP